MSLRFLSFVWGFVIPGGSLSQRVVSLCPDFLTGDGTLGTEYRLRGERRKSQEGLDLLRDDLTARSRKRTKRHFFAILLTLWVVGSCDGSVYRIGEFNFYATTAVKSGDSK